MTHVPPQVLTAVDKDAQGNLTSAGHMPVRYVPLTQPRRIKEGQGEREGEEEREGGH